MSNHDEAILENSDFDDHKIKFATDACKEKRVLDIGCVNHDPLLYKSKFWLHKALRVVSDSLIGLDIDSEGVAFLKSKGFNVVHGDAQNFDFEEPFDVIVAGDLIEHLSDVGGFFESCRRNMHADSRLMISTPNPWFWKFWVQAFYKREIPNNLEHTCWFCPRTLRQIADRFGFEIVRFHFGSRFWRDKFLPLPAGVRHGTFHAELVLKPSIAK